MKILHWLNSNSEAGSQKNIAAHYDLGNPLFELFLDPTMMYSSAVFNTETRSLQQASELKLKMICVKLQLKPSDHVIEIGTGWGGFALFAARHYGWREDYTDYQRWSVCATRKRSFSFGHADVGNARQSCRSAACCGGDAANT